MRGCWTRHGRARWSSSADRRSQLVAQRGQRPLDRRVHVDAGRVEYGHRCIVRADQEVDLGAAVDDPARPRRFELRDDATVRLARGLAHLTLAELAIDDVMHEAEVRL